MAPNLKPEIEIMKTLIIGASPNPNRYSYLAAQRLKEAGHEVVLLGKTTGQLIGQDIQVAPPHLTDVHTITLYINPTIQKENYYDYIIQLQPKRLIFNPGTENKILTKLAKEKGIEVLEACTLVLLRTHQY